MSTDLPPNLMQQLAKKLDGLLGPESGFILMVVPFNGNVGDYGQMVSSVDVDDVAEILEGFAEDLRIGKIVAPTAGEVN